MNEATWLDLLFDNPRDDGAPLGNRFTGESVHGWTASAATLPEKPSGGRARAVGKTDVRPSKLQQSNLRTAEQVLLLVRFDRASRSRVWISPARWGNPHSFPRDGV